MPVAPTVSELPLQDIRFLFAGIPQIRMLPDKLKQTGKAGLGEFKLVAHFPASMSNTEADKKAYMARHATFQNGQYGIYYDGTYKLDEIEWDATNRAGVHLVTQDKYGNTVQFPVAPSKSVPGDLKLMISEYVESLVNPPVMIRCSALGGRISPDPNNPGTFDLTVNPQQPKCPVKARNHVPAKYHAENVELDHGRYVVDASALTDAEIEYLDFYLYGAEEEYNAPYTGSGALSGVGLSTDQLTSTWGSGTFDQASLNSSGHMNVFANAEEYNAQSYNAERIRELEEQAMREYCEDVPWDEIISMLSEDEQEEYYSLLQKKGYNAEEGNTPVMPPMEFGEMANWRPLDGTPGLKRNRAENQDMMCCGDSMEFYDDYFYCPVCETTIETNEFDAEFTDNAFIVGNIDGEPASFQYSAGMKDDYGFTPEHIITDNDSSKLYGLIKSLGFQDIDNTESFKKFKKAVRHQKYGAEYTTSYSDQGAIQVDAEIEYSWWVDEGPDNLNEWEVDREVKSAVTYEFNTGDYGQGNQSSLEMPRNDWVLDDDITVQYQWKLVIGDHY